MTFKRQRICLFIWDKSNRTLTFLQGCRVTVPRPDSGLRLFHVEATSVSAASGKNLADCLLYGKWLRKERAHLVSQISRQLVVSLNPTPTVTPDSSLAVGRVPRWLWAWMNLNRAQIILSSHVDQQENNGSSENRVVHRHFEGKRLNL